MLDPLPSPAPPSSPGTGPVVVVERRLCLTGSAVVLLALAMVPPLADGRVAVYTPWAVAFAAAAGGFALAACVLPPRTWHVRLPFAGRLIIPVAALLLAAEAVVLPLVPWIKTAGWPEV